MNEEFDSSKALWTSQRVYGGICETARHDRWRMESSYVETITMPTGGSRSWRTCRECHKGLIELFLTLDEEKYRLFVQDEGNDYR